MRRAAPILLLIALFAAPAAAQVAPPGGAASAPVVSMAVGKPWNGRLVNGVQLPPAAPNFVTWDPVLQRTPNRPERRWGTEALLLFLERVADEYRAAHPQAPPLLIADLSRPHGGPFGKRYGGLGHASHQNGRDADVMYPRADHALRGALRPSQIDHPLAQDLVDRFVAAGAVKLFVGFHTGLTGPGGVVQPLAFHDDHVHVRIPDPG